MFAFLKQFFARQKDYTQLLEDFETSVAGVTAKNDNGVDRQSLLRRLRAGDPLLIVRDRRNRHDRNAIAVAQADGQRLGYIPTKIAAPLAALLDQGATGQGRVIAVTGGEPTKPTLGLWIRVIIIR